MQIGQIIRKHRKAQNLTQEEMAVRLGVTAPAVNKWENGNSYPDIMMLAPIARLLNISLDTLLSFHSELTDEEIKTIVREADERFKKDTYMEAFQWVKMQIEMYPNCKMLIWQLAVILDARKNLGKASDASKEDDFILNCYKWVLEAEDEKIRTGAAGSLFSYYVRKEQYEKAEEYLAYYSEQSPERKRKQALIFSKTNRRQEAYKTYEELLFSGYQMLNLIFTNMYMMAMEDGNVQKAHKLIEKQQEVAKVFEMGIYHEVSLKLDLAVAEKDSDTVIDTMKKMLESVETITDFTESDLYEHMQFNKSDKVFIEELKRNLMNCMKDNETFGFLKDDERWKNMIQ